MQSVSTRCTASRLPASNNHETRQGCCTAGERRHEHTRKQTNKQTNKQHQNSGRPKNGGPTQLFPWGQGKRSSKLANHLYRVLRL